MNCIKLIIAFIFLFNPQVNLIDILPDFIAWLLILSSLNKVRYLSVQMENSIPYIIKICVLNMVGFMSFLLMPQFDPTMILTITFSLNVLKLVWGIPALKSLFSGFSELSGLYDGCGIYLPIHKSAKEGIVVAEKLTLFFHTAMAIISTVPEFSELTRDSSLIMSEGRRPLYTFKPLLYFISVTIALVIGIIWLAYIIPFIKNIGKDKTFLANIINAYNIRIVETGKHRALELKNSFLILSVSAILFLPLTLDGMNFLPRFILPILIFVFALKISRNGYKSNLLITLSIVSAVCSLIAYTLRWIFIIKFSYESIERSFAAYDLFVITATLVVIELILFTVTQIILNKRIYSIAVKDAILDPSEISDERIQQKIKSEAKAYKKKLTISTILFALSALTILLSFISYLLILPRFDFIALIISVIWLIYSCSVYSKIRENIDKKYL